MLTASQITAQIVNQLKFLDPAVSAETGTVERKLIEATAELIASQQVDFSILNQQHDLASMSGGKLEAYLSIYNFGRQQATPSYGIVTFSRSASASSQIVIPRGTQVRANIDDSAFPSLIFVTTETVVLEVDTTSVNAPAQCTVAGTIGNIDANTIVGFGGLRQIAGIIGVSNSAAFSGGSDMETDEAYKVRFQNSFLRNISGTYDMFLALAVAASGVTKANVVGAISRYQEYVQVPMTDDATQLTTGGYDPSGTTFPHKKTSAKSTIPYSKYTYKSNYYVTNGTLDPATAKFFRPDVDYVFNSPPIDASGVAQVATTPATTPNITFLNAYDAASNTGGNPDIAEGDVLLFEHAYISTHSRNDYDYGILNCVDVFINGSQPSAVTSVEVVPGTSNLVQNSTTSLWTYQKLTATKVVNFKRKLDGTASAIGSLLQPLNWQPVLALPDVIQVGTNTYYQANYWNPSDSTYYNQYDGSTYSLPAHYILTEEVNSAYGTIRCRNGIEWFQSGNNYLNGQLVSDTGNTYSGVKIESLAGTQFTAENYYYDKNISELQAVMERNKQVATDVLVHRARWRYFRPIVTIMYSLGSTRAVVDASIIAALSAFLENQYYGSAIQLSDILQAIHNVPGVDNVRWTNETPGQTKLEEVAFNGNSFSTPIYITADFYIQDNELASSPSSNAITITARAQSTFGS